MLEHKNFYFVRHGETAHNAKNIIDDPTDIPLNKNGYDQAQNIKDVISLLPIKTICHSPLLRAKQTKDIISQGLAVQHIAIDGLRECTGHQWLNMTYHSHTDVEHHVDVKSFFERVQDGINMALTYDAVLIVAHGGVFWAMCKIMGIKADWFINGRPFIRNCQIAHLQFDANIGWYAKLIEKQFSSAAVI